MNRGKNILFSKSRGPCFSAVAKPLDLDTVVNVVFSSDQRAEAILNKISNNINKTHTGLISVVQEFQICIAWNPSN